MLKPVSGVESTTGEGGAKYTTARDGSQSCREGPTSNLPSQLVYPGQKVRRPIGTRRLETVTMDSDMDSAVTELPYKSDLRMDGCLAFRTPTLS